MEVARASSARWLALVAVTGIVLYLCWLMLAPFIDVLLWGAVLAIVVWPVKRRIERAGYSSHISAMLTTGLTVLVVLIPLILITTAVVQQGGDAVGYLQGGIKRLLDPDSRAMVWLDAHFDLSNLRDPKLLGSKLRGGVAMQRQDARPSTLAVHEAPPV